MNEIIPGLIWLIQNYYMKDWKRFKLLLIPFFACLFLACEKNPSGPKVFTQGYYTLNLNPASLVPGDTSTQSFAAGTFSVMQDNQLYYDLYFTKILGGEAPSKITIYQGDPLTNGSVLLGIDNVSFNNKEMQGNVTAPQVIIDSFGGRAPMYVIISTPTHPNGLVRGTLAPTGGVTSNFGKDILLSKDSIKPSINVPTTATVFLRLLSDNATLYSMVNINNLPAGDSVVIAAIRSRVDNSVALQLATSKSMIGVSRKQTVSLSSTPITNSGQYYIDVRTKLYPNGIVKGFY